MKKNKVTQKIIFLTIMLVALAGVFGFLKWQGEPKGGDAVSKITWQDHTYIYDQADLLSDTTENNLNHQLENLDVGKKAQIIVLTVDDLKNKTIQEYANAVFNQTGIGDKASDNGLLMLIAKDEKKVWVEVGQGLEGELNDGKVGRILDTDFVPYRAKDDYDTAVTKTISAFSDVLTGYVSREASSDETSQNDDNDETTHQSRGSSLGGMIIFGIILMFVFGMIFTGHGDVLVWLLLAIFNNRGGGSGGYGGGSSGSSGGSGGFGGGSSSGGGAGR
ncbi:hypothetical protein FACS1894193_04980 [Bacilli bacterium]|nr:hypothetical protein FACS1894193_04980 [Bacilli bacterium]